MNSFVNLIESGRPAANDFDDDTVTRTLVALQRHCRQQGGLHAEGVWRLDRNVALQLEQTHGIRPPGGWRALCALAVGTGILKALDDQFISGDADAETVVEDPREARRMLGESFTRWLIPPATAAGLFLAMGVHPLWGLRLARRLHVDAPMLDGQIEGWRDEELLPEHDLHELRKGIFAGLSTIFSALSRLDTNCRYGIEALIGFVGDAIAFGRNQIEADGDGLEVLIDEVDHADKAVCRSIEFAADELIDGVLVPAGVMRRYDDDTFGVDATVLEHIRVGRLGADARRTWLQCFLVEFDDELVA